PHWGQREPEPWVPALRIAIREGHAVRMHYRDAEGRDSERVVWPFAMAFLDDLRLIAAWCESRNDFRHFRADRVLSLESTGHRYPETRHQLLRRWEQQCLRQRVGPEQGQQLFRGERGRGRGGRGAGARDGRGTGARC